MSLCGAAVVPHPPIIVPAVGGRELSTVRATVDAMKRLGREVAALKPEVFILLSPHAPLDPDRMAVCAAARYRGSLGMFGAPQVQVDLEGDPALARSIVERARGQRIPVMSYHDGSVANLDHGATVPLYYLLEGLAALKVDKTPLLVELNFCFAAPSVHVSFGRVIREVIDQDSRSIFYVASGDLSHRLTPSAPAGYDPRGAEFDQEVVEIFAGGKLEALAQIPAGLVEAAGECGYRSLLVLAGVLEGSPYRTHLLSYEGPFGVGYLVGKVELEPAGDPLVKLARETIEKYVRERRLPEPHLPPGNWPDRAGVFVSLHKKDGSLRGCIGTISPTQRTLAEEIVRNAVSAATQDPRFYPVEPDELDDLEISVDVLGKPEPVSDVSELDPKRYGIIVRAPDGRQALLLPDLEGVDTVEQQLAITCRKGGIDPVRDRYTIERFEVVRHEDRH